MFLLSWPEFFCGDVLAKLQSHAMFMLASTQLIRWYLAADKYSMGCSWLCSACQLYRNSQIGFLWVEMCTQNEMEKRNGQNPAVNSRPD